MQSSTTLTPPGIPGAMPLSEASKTLAARLDAIFQQHEEDEKLMEAQRVEIESLRAELTRCKAKLKAVYRALDEGTAAHLAAVDPLAVSGSRNLTQRLADDGMEQTPRSPYADSFLLDSKPAER